MLQPSPTIQGPSPEVLGALLKTIEEGQLVSGPAFCHDPVRRVFMMIIVHEGVIVDWQIVPAHDAAHAAALQSHYMHAAVNAARMVTASLPPDEREAALRELVGRVGTLPH